MRYEDVELFLKQGAFRISEYSFNHVCMPLTITSPDSVLFAFNMCRDLLGLKTSPELGFTVIITNEWMFVSVLTQPYGESAHGYPVYLDGFSFAGLVSLQDEVPVWPATAGLVDNKHTVTKAI